MKKEVSNIICNADMRVREIRQFCKQQEEGQCLMWAAMSQLNLSARVEVSRTIADLAGSQEIQSAHLEKSLQCLPKLMIGALVAMSCG